MTSFLDTLINFLASLFGGNKNEQPAEKPVEAPKPEPKMLMSETTFNFMTSSESEATKERLRKEMAEKDALGVWPYTVETEKNIYTIDRARHETYKHLDLTDQYGTMFETKAKSK